MKRLLGLAALLAATAGLLVAAAGAAIRAPTGDTCSANGSGTAYAIAIQLAPNSPQQDGFAFGAQGATVTAAKIGGVAQGRSYRTNLPANTTTAWLLGSPAAVAGAQVTANVVTNRPVTGTFTVVPYDQQHDRWYDAITCALSKSPVPKSNFGVDGHFTHSAGTHAWSTFVTVPGPGKVNYSQKGGTKLLIAQGRVAVSHAGRVKITVRTTPKGREALAASGSLKVKLSIEFSPTNGTPANKIVSLTLRP
jgi:hypothetical protein